MFDTFVLLSDVCHHILFCAHTWETTKGKYSLWGFLVLYSGIYLGHKT